MKKNVLIKDGKEIVIAASAAITMGVGTSLTHQVLTQAAETSTSTETTPTDSATLASTTSTTPAPTATATSATPTKTLSTKTDIATVTETPATITPTTTTPSSTGDTTGTSTLSSSSTSTTGNSSGDGTDSASTSSSPASTTPVAVTTTPATTPVTTPTTPVTTPATTPVTTPATTPATAPVTTNTPTTTAPATSASEYTPSDNFTWSTDASSGTATVTGLATGSSTITSINLPPTINLNGVNYKVTAIGDNAFQFNNNLTTVTLNDGLTTIGKEAFYSNESLTNVIFNDGLENIGTSAFAYNSKLATVDFSKNTTLQTIGDDAFVSDPIISLILPNSVTSIGKTAFAYNPALLTLTLPNSLQTISDQAFASNTELQSVVFDKALNSIGYQAFIYDNNLSTLNLTNSVDLQTIGTGAFEFDKVSGDLSVPASVTSVGDQAFLSNQLTGLSYSGSNLSLGNEAFKYNRIVNISAPNVSITGSFGSGIGGYQVDTIFTDPTHDKISNFFNINADGYGEQYLGIFGLTNGVTYSNGMFDIPNGTENFAFNWSIGPEYNGQYNVVLNNPVIKAINSVIIVDSNWSPEDNFVGCTLEDGAVVPLSSMTVSIKDPAGKTVSSVDTSTLGTYQVTYSYGEYSTVVNVSVEKNSGTYAISGSNSSTYSGSTPAETGSYQVALSNGDTYTTKPGDVEFTTQAIDAGTYQVQLTAQGLAAINTLQGGDLYNWELGTNNSSYVIEKLPITITAENAAKTSGESDPTLTGQVSNGVTDAKYTVSRVPGETVGTYEMTVTPAEDANPNYDITVVPGTFTITGIDGEDYTMKVGDPAPTLADFKAIAYDLNGPIPLGDISLNLNGANLTKNGDYNITLSTADGMTKEVVLHVTGGTEDNNSGGSTGPTEPGDSGNQGSGNGTEGPETPTNPEQPGNPEGPETPTNPEQPGNPEGPETPTNPEQPGNPEGPETPTNPEQPGNPEGPETPTNPEQPGNPEGPETPTNPEQPGNPEGPETPTNPEQPGNSKGPTTSEISTSNNSTTQTSRQTPIINGDSEYSGKNTVKYLGSKGSLTKNLLVTGTVSANKSSQVNSGVTKGKFPQTGNKNSLMATISGILLGLLSLMGIDIKHRKNNH
ncbi:leucine-rich repeat protein [Companilactobacillus keshanensis]|nr:leucine-rich repeat protein [Companilactobacillus keshanensis]